MVNLPTIDNLVVLAAVLQVRLDDILVIDADWRMNRKEKE